MAAPTSSLSTPFTRWSVSSPYSSRRKLGSCEMVSVTIFLAPVRGRSSPLAALRAARLSRALRAAALSACVVTTVSGRWDRSPRGSLLAGWRLRLRWRRRRGLRHHVDHVRCNRLANVRDPVDYARGLAEDVHGPGDGAGGHFPGPQRVFHVLRQPLDGVLGGDGAA